jgi:DNA-binding XRE family transcriptional regulator
MFLKPKGSEISKKRLEAGLTRYALSKKAGLGSYAIARMEENLHCVHQLRAKAVAEVLGCNINDLFELQNEQSVLETSDMQKN